MGSAAKPRLGPAAKVACTRPSTRRSWTRRQKGQPEFGLALSPLFASRAVPAKTLAGSARGVRPDCAPGQSGSDPRSRLAPAVHLELLQNIVNVVFHGGHLDPQPLRDLLVREALIDEPHDLALALGETRWDSIGAAIGREGGDPAQQRARYPG